MGQSLVRRLQQMYDARPYVPQVYADAIRFEDDPTYVRSLASLVQPLPNLPSLRNFLPQR